MPPVGDAIMQVDEPSSRLNDTGTHGSDHVSQTVTEENTAPPTIRPPRRSDSFSSDLSVITEDGVLADDDNVKGPEVNKSLMSGRWVEDEEASPQSRVRLVDRTDFSDVMKVIDDAMEDLQQVPSEESDHSGSSWGSAVHRVQKRLAAIRSERRAANMSGSNYMDTSRSASSSPLSNGDVDTLSQLKLERDSVVAHALERAELARKRRAKLFEACRALMAFVMYCRVFVCKDMVEMGNNERIWLAAELSGVLFICYLSTVAIESPKETSSANLWDILLSRKAVLLITYLVLWSLLFSTVAGSVISREQCSPLWKAREATVGKQDDSPRDASCMMEMNFEDILVEVGDPQANENPQGQIQGGKEEVEDPILQESLKRWTDAALKNPLAIPPFLRNARHADSTGQPPPEKSTRERGNVFASQIDQCPAEASLGEIRLNEMTMFKNHSDEALRRSVGGFLASFRALMRKIFFRFIAALLGNSGDTDGALFDTIVEVWAGRD